ncbi:MAG: alkaline phosphatase family protein, partial [Verrucomicrobiota bacterium]
AWFTYYYWLDDAKAPDFARTVAIHAKPGYDPCEMLIDPAIALPKLKVAGKLLRKAAGLRYLMDVIPLDAGLIKGSHGLCPQTEENQPLYVSTIPCEPDEMAMCGVKNEILRLIFDV